MRRAFLFAAGLIAVALPARAIGADCPGPAPGLLLHECRGAFAVSVLLLPDDLDRLGVPPGPRLLVTGAYTSAETRDGGLPLPVGLFLRAGALVNRQFAPMDGVLLIDPEGGAGLFHRARVRFRGQDYDLTDREARAGFLDAAATAGASVLQSHLLIIDGAVDVRPSEDAPRYRRRLLFTDGDGRVGLWQSDRFMTLHEAAVALAAAYRPRMALNLDMGSYDLCLRLSAGAAPGEGESCGVLGWQDSAKLSNLLVFDLAVD